MSSPLNPINLRFPLQVGENADPGMAAIVRYLTSGVVDLNQAIAALKSQLDALSTTVTTVQAASSSTTVAGVTSFNTLTGAVTYFPNLGTISDQTGLTAYTTLSSDSGALLIVNDAAPVAITLDSTLIPPYFFFVTNFGAGTATLSPLPTGTINGSASYALLQNYFAVVVFDGTNWSASAALLPANTPAVTHQFFTAYNSVTGAFSQAQPNANDVSNPYVAVSATYAILTTDYQIECTSGTFTATLPTAVGVAGKVYSIKNSGTGVITVATTSSQAIDSSTTQVLNQWDNLMVMSNGANWMVI